MTPPPAPSPSRPVTRVPGERPNARGEATRQRILGEAERLFAERGIEAVPLRDIGMAAGQRNHAAVQYHFGDRMQLIQEIVEFRGGASDERRATMVADLMFTGTPPGVTDIIGAFVRPLAMHLQEDNHYLGFLSRFITEEGGYEALGDRGTHAGASVVTLRALLTRIVPEVPEKVLDERWWVTLTSAVHTLARYQSAQRKREHLPAQVDVLIDDLVAYLSAGIVAPVVEGDPRLG
ncbi:TetR/AcrR family transcriptional regulator [Herbiconiux daphne]|uniref:TetR/AcrR family transcriptional regulator n=1 Tax=Herbiconiux daphne TaxID=2970914 RepID=A0ABT2H831_9MICO|nr:TetR/AcrR family transcriptional regulator [Herbiconiux daphne]MCS5736087.1 TetR/AcrR family transcriptional regulator [Herbiconiux daphne]